ncbi:uncharacterized protein LOC134182357 isoform X2 [Corticium candelabrum]|uniref:uncharacterized protein LOC134182357 isoform X2 n=1 Tax=Corticium candelabrum TaxID=121492 RepID=UPI002E25BD44|nr:uncharacterized protein LOC134182357 isoform X2 [Corticium candelabrum]
MAGAIIFSAIFVSAFALAASGLLVAEQCPPCIEKPGLPYCVCKVARWEYKEGEVMLLSELDKNHVLLSETECTCVRPDRVDSEKETMQNVNARDGRFRRQADACQPSRTLLVLQRSDGATVTKADICFVVDESGSMVQEHRWLVDTVAELDKKLRGEGLQEIRYCLIGYGAREHLLGSFIINGGKLQDVKNGIRSLLQTGKVEDGYAAMYLAFSNNGSFTFTTGADASRVIVLVTDEDRDNLADMLPENVKLDYEEMLNYLTTNDVILNVVVNQYFKDTNRTDSLTEEFAFGMDYLNRSYFLSQRNYTRIETQTAYPVHDGGYGTTLTDYVNMALKTNGSAWDLKQLRSGTTEQVAAFTDAFIDMKVEEIITRTFETCRVCDCSNGEHVCREDDQIPRDQCKIEEKTK